MNHKIQLKNLSQGPNEVCMEIFNKYRNDGNGLHSFVDSVDKEQYLFTQFEADFCHFVFPCFDQPDIKANWTLKAVVDHDWTVIANDYVDESIDINQKKALLESLTAIGTSFE